MDSLEIHDTILIAVLVTVCLAILVFSWYAGNASKKFRNRFFDSGFFAGKVLICAICFYGLWFIYFYLQASAAISSCDVPIPTFCLSILYIPMLIVLDFLMTILKDSGLPILFLNIGTLFIIPALYCYFLAFIIFNLNVLPFFWHWRSEPELEDKNAE